MRKAFITIFLIVVIHPCVAQYLTFDGKKHNGGTEQVILSQQFGRSDNTMGHPNIILKNKLTLYLLKNATLIKYSFSNGPVAPDYQYSGYISVCKERVEVSIIGKRCIQNYSSSIPLSAKDYTNFLNALYAQDIRMLDHDEPVMMGAGASNIVVKDHKKILFEGDEYINLSIGEGYLKDQFLNVLPEHVRKVVNDPYDALLKQTNDEYLFEMDNSEVLTP